VRSVPEGLRPLMAAVGLPITLAIAPLADMLATCASGVYLVIPGTASVIPAMIAGLLALLVVGSQRTQHLSPCAYTDRAALRRESSPARPSLSGCPRRRCILPLHAAGDDSPARSVLLVALRRTVCSHASSRRYRN